MSMMKNLIHLIYAMVIGCLVFSCNSQNTKSENNTEEVAADSSKFGEPVDETAAMTLSKLEQEMVQKDSITNITVTAKVTEVCQMKGCWMTLEKDNGDQMRVTFKDYALFMPKDIAGKEVVIRGKAFTDTVSVDVLKHYAEDAGKTEEEIESITQPEVAMAFEADGVLIKN